MIPPTLTDTDSVILRSVMVHVSDLTTWGFTFSTSFIPDRTSNDIFLQCSQPRLGLIDER